MNSKSASELTTSKTTNVRPQYKVVAVIDIGATSVRMAIAEIESGSSEVRHLEALTQAVSVGKDVFIHGVIHRATIEDCVRVLKIYRQKLEEYQIDDPSAIRVVATSAVREARNRFAFLDRIFIATGFDVEPFDEAELHRVTYLGVRELLSAPQFENVEQFVVCEVGGGSTEALIVSNQAVSYSQTFRLGALRLRRTLEAYHTPSRKLRSVMERQIDLTAHEIRQRVDLQGGPHMIAMGGDLRFAVGQLTGQSPVDGPVSLPLNLLEAFIDGVFNRSVDDLVREYHLSFPEAETLTPALMIYAGIARALKMTEIQVANINLRDGLLMEMATPKSWTSAFNDQIIESARELGRKYSFDEAHSSHVAELCVSIFQQTQKLHQLDARYELILYIAALLHEIGMFVSHRSMHKHSMYLIRNCELFGLSKRDLLVVALVARYHRRAHPQPSHESYSDLPRDARVAVSKLASLIRIAIALDDARGQRIRDIQCRVTPKQLLLQVPNIEDITVEQLAIQQNSALFEEVFGKQVRLRPLRP